MPPKINSVTKHLIKGREKDENTEVKVHVCYERKPGEIAYDESRLITLTHTSVITEVGVLITIFPNDEILKDHLGYKMVGEDTEHRIELTVVDDDIMAMAPKDCKYSIVVKLPITKQPETEDFSKLLDSKKFSDVKLSIGDKDIHAHKVILANKSPVFEAMFTHEMAESQTNTVEIKDTDYNTMYEFLRYIYLGKLDRVEYDCEDEVVERYSNLLRVADKYGTASLKTRCEEKLPIFFTIQNVLDCLLLADTHNALQLKKEAIDFIVSYVEKIIDLPSYKHFVDLHADLSIEITRALAKERKSQGKSKPDVKKRKIQ